MLTEGEEVMRMGTEIRERHSGGHTGGRTEAWGRYVASEREELEKRKSGLVGRLLGRPLPSESGEDLRRFSEEDRERAGRGLVLSSFAGNARKNDGLDGLATALAASRNGRLAAVDHEAASTAGRPIMRARSIRSLVEWCAGHGGLARGEPMPEQCEM